jgi:hypothetical protein
VFEHRRIVFVAFALATLTFTGSAAANICMDKWKADRAVHADLQRKAIEELNNKDYVAACKTMRELTELSQSMRTWLQRNCRGNETAKRGEARADTVAQRTKEICEQAEKR